MSDKKNQHEEEYQYPSDEYVEGKTQQEPVSETETLDVEENKVAGVLGFIVKKRKALLMVLVVVAVFVAFKIMTSDRKPQTVAVKKPVTHYVAPQVSRPNPQVESQVDKLASTVQQNQSALASMQDQIDTMQSALDRANNSYQNTTKALQLLSQQLVKLQTQLKPHKSVVKKSKTATPVVFHLKAIVPGRAWVFATNGLVETVSVGDVLPQYGRITKIDSDKGIVLTSSGKIIEYGVDDY